MYIHQVHPIGLVIETGILYSISLILLLFFVHTKNKGGQKSARYQLSLIIMLMLFMFGLLSLLGLNYLTFGTLLFSFLLVGFIFDYED